jgi:demethylmacrocin O-methyltransferase
MEATCSPSLVKRLKRIVKGARAWWHRNDLNRLALLFCSDKWGCHWYTPHYDRHFRHLKYKSLNILEIGVGGYQHSEIGGGSLKMWKAYFRKSAIVGIDLYDKTHFSEHRIDVRQCDQADADRLVQLSSEYGGFDIVIDDGSHLSDHVIKSFETLFPLLRPNGIYVVEDLQTAYWTTWGGGMENPNNSMAYFKGLVDGLNYMEYPIAGYKPTYFDENIVGISFVHNLVFIQKGKNDEKTNDPELIQREQAALVSAQTNSEACEHD